MSSWTWAFEDADGGSLLPSSAPGQGFPSQADAEAWVGEAWRDLLDDGVEQVRLLVDGKVVYGPMSLRAT